MKHKLEHHKELCIGCAACVAVDPKTWFMDGDKAELIGSEKSMGKDGLIETKQVSHENVEKAQEAASVCPVPCIFFKEIKSK